ncbi:hypothetical protein ACA910_010229 [Epithemia clementina (nom. ined.)]
MDAFDHHLIKGPTNALIQNHIKLRSWGAGIGNMHYPSLAHFNKSDDPNANQLFDEELTVLPKLVVDTQEQIPDFHCVKVLNTKDSGVHQHDFQGQDEYDNFTSYEIVNCIFDTCNSSQGYFDAKSTVIGSGITKHNDPKSQVGYQIQEYKEAIEQDDTSKNYGKAYWAIGAIVLAYLVIVLGVHGHCTNNFELWGAANLALTLLLEAIINLTNFIDDYLPHDPLTGYTITTLSKSFSTRTDAAQDTEFRIFPTYFGVLICFLLLAFHQFCGAIITKGFAVFWMTHSILSKFCCPLLLELALTKSFMCNLKEFSNLCIPTKICTFDVVWASLKIFNKFYMPLVDNANIITTNNLWGNITNIPMLDVDSILMAHHDLGGHKPQFQFFDWILHEFHLWHKTNNVAVHLLGIFMHLVDWGDTYPFPLHLSHHHHLIFHHQVHQDIALAKQFTNSSHNTRPIPLTPLTGSFGMCGTFFPSGMDSRISPSQRNQHIMHCGE